MAIRPLLAICALALGCSSPLEPPDAPGADAPLDTPSSDVPGSDVPGSDAGPVAVDPSPGCGATPGYPAGASTEASLTHDALERTFRVHVPPGYDGTAPLPLVLMFHGGGGSGLQLETASSGMSTIADREGFVAVYPDGTGALRTWNGGGCCGAAVRDDVDDVGFVAALLDHLEGALCLDRARVYASGMSNGGIFSHRLACELTDRLAAIAPVAGTDLTASCDPSRAIAVMHVHGTDDGHVPFDGGEGCGPAGVAFTSVPETMTRWRTRNGCSASGTEVLVEGDGACERYDGCSAGGEVRLCVIDGGGHSWPGGAPGADVIDCPADGEQSTTFFASEQIWRFFADHPRR